MKLWRRRARSGSGPRAERLSAEAIHMKARAMLAVRYLREEIAQRLGRDDAWSKAFRDGDDGALDEVAAIARSRAGISLADYRKVYRHDLQLVSAQQRAIGQASLGS
jgi:hypothetical protein